MNYLVFQKKTKKLVKEGDPNGLHKKTRYLNHCDCDKRGSSDQNVLIRAMIEMTKAAISTTLSASHNLILWFLLAFCSRSTISLLILIISSVGIAILKSSFINHHPLTEMRRVTISIPDELDAKVLELKKDDRFVRCSYSEIVRMLLTAGLEAAEAKKEAV